MSNYLKINLKKSWFYSGDLVPRTMLTVQHRMPVEIMNAVSAFAYDNLLEMGKKDLSLKPEIAKFMATGFQRPLTSTFIVLKHKGSEEKVH